MLYSPNIKQPWYLWDGFRIWEFRDKKWHWNVSSWDRDWFLAVNLQAWPHACDFVLGFLGRDLPLLWTLHHWRGEISEFHLWFASGLFVKHNCLPGPEPSLDSEKVKFTLSLCSLWMILMAGVYWRPWTLGGIAQRMSRVQGWALRGKDLYVLETEDVKAVEEDLRAGGAACRSSLNHYCTHVPMLCPQPYLQSGVYINHVSHRFQMTETHVWLTGAKDSWVAQRTKEGRKVITGGTRIQVWLWNIPKQELLHLWFSWWQFPYVASLGHGFRNPLKRFVGSASFRYPTLTLQPWPVD